MAVSPRGRKSFRGGRAFALAGIACLLLTARAYSADCTPAPAGQVAWWPGDLSALDLAGTNNGTLSGGVVFGAGEVDSAFSLDGFSGTVVVPDSSSLRLTNSFTIEAWINPRNADGDEPILSKISAVTGNNGYQLVLYHGTILGQFNSPGQTWPSSQLVYGGPIATGVWQHVAFTYDQSAMTIYLNGSSVALNVIGPKVIATSTSPLRIGGVEGNALYFDGLLDEVSVYNRALSAGEIATIYAAQSAGKCKRPWITSQPQSQLGYWADNITFTVAAMGSAPLSYQWQFNNTPISGANGSSLLLTNLDFTNAGIYSVVISNTTGMIMSSNANLTINPSGVSVDLYAGVTITGVSGKTYGVQFTTDLSNTNSWQGLTNVTLSGTNAVWYDPQPANHPKRYYRVVPGPIPIP
jgi:hypothetical protein